MRRFLPSKKHCYTALAVLVMLSGWAYWNRAFLLSRYYVSQLAQADEANRAECVREVVQLGEVCVPLLLDRLGTDEAVSLNMTHGLCAMCAEWGIEDNRTENLLSAVKDAFDGSDSNARTHCLKVFACALETLQENRPLPANVSKRTAELLECAAANRDCLATTLQVTRAYIERVSPGQGVTLARELALTGLAQTDDKVRLAAVQLIMQAALKKDPGLLGKLAPLIKDGNVELRKAALLALANERDFVDDDDLLALLHDPDAEVQILCELALSSRGLTENHILLGKLISDPNPSSRLLVLDHLHRAPDLDPGVWLHRLSTDPIPAVRAAAVRAGAMQKPAEFRPRLHEMSRLDPSLTVRQLANFYLSRNPLRYEEE